MSFSREQEEMGAMADILAVRNEYRLQTWICRNQSVPQPKSFFHKPHLLLEKWHEKTPQS